ncbi:MAG TPA: hypothetical protein VGU23_04210, partial [Acidobacteriaceae bacterium]|nr:hypothetical protein [Acidobacteriaceae bacterium]
MRNEQPFGNSSGAPTLSAPTEAANPKMRPVFFRAHLPLSSPEEYGWRWWLSVWLPVLFAIAIIATESTDTFSAQHTSSWLRPILERFLGRFTDPGWDSFHHYLRKSGHF